MMRIAQFFKVSEKQFVSDCMNEFLCDEQEAKRIYDQIQLPLRATKGSAGYDFYSPISFSLKPLEEIKIPTGIKAKMENGWVLQCFPRSSLGFKFSLKLNNTVGIIDSDYFYSENEGHIFIKLTNQSSKNQTLNVKAGEGIVQGIFIPFGITLDDQVEEIRNGGFGSTNK